MRNRYRMFRRGVRYYAKDKSTGKAVTLNTSDREEAKTLLQAKNQAVEQAHLNLAMARVYLSCKTPEMLERTWNDVMLDMEQAYHGPTLKRWRVQMKCGPFQSLRKLKLVETEASHFLFALRHPRAGSSVLKWLRIVHNRALDLGWLLSPVLARKLWPRLKTKKSKAVTAQQHARLVSTEKDDEFRLYLEMLWEIGGAQTDTARLRRENVDLFNRRLTYTRQKLENIGQGSVAIVIGNDLMKILEQLPKEGFLFPTLAEQDDKVRSSRFRKRCDRLGFKEITLHGYRYAWAQRAKAFGMPLREAMSHLGHGSKAIHLAYSQQAEVVSLPLEFYEKQWKEKIVQFKHAVG
jgi:integrase